MTYEEQLMAEIEELRVANRAWGRQFAIVMQFQNAGTEAERRGDTAAAIAEYRRAVDSGMRFSRIGINNYFHSLERLCVLFRKEKLYGMEVEHIELLMRLLSEKPKLGDSDRRYLFKYEKRLNRAKELLDRYGPTPAGEQ